MRSALCLMDGEILDASFCNQQPQDWIDQRRPLFVCPACGAKARLRVGSPERAPGFGASHATSCLLFGRTWSAFRYLQ